MSALDFYLNGLDTSANSIHADLSGNGTAPLYGDASAEIDVSLNLLKGIFKFQTDSTDVDNVVADDVKYKVVDPGASWVYSPADATMYANEIFSTALNQVQHDWVRYLAQSLFGTHLGVDLFTNEEEVRSNLVTESLTAIKSRFTALANLGVLTDANVLDEETGTVQINPSRQILRQIIAQDSTRLDEFWNDPAVDGNGFFEMPLRAGDKLYFVFTAKSHANQHEIVDDVLAPPSNRTYLIRLNVV
jgi:hypothetical protein